MRNNQRGLTLVELLVAISVLATIAVLGWRGLDSIVRARMALASELELTRGMQLTFAQLQSDCLHLVSLPNRSSFNAQSGQLNLVRNVLTEDQATQLQVVSYQVKDGALTRRESAVTRDLTVLDKMWLSAIGNTDAAPAVTLQLGVGAMTMRLWFTGSSGWSIPFTASPATSIASVVIPPAPSGLEVSLQLQGQPTSLIKVFLLGAM